MGLYQHIREQWKKPQESVGQLWHERLIAWRRELSTLRIERPTRLDRARSLGYRAKQGFIMVRQRVPRGGQYRPRPKSGRRSKRFGTLLNLRKSYKLIAEERTQKTFENLVVLNSYWVAQDGRYYWYEVVLVDPSHPVIKADRTINWVCNPKNRSRVFHGKTSEGKKTRGMVR